MRVPFACPSCAAKGVVDDAHLGKQVRCKHCGATFVLRHEEEPEPEVYSLDQDEESVARGPEHGSAFVRSRGAEVSGGKPGRRPRGTPAPAAGLTPRREATKPFPWKMLVVGVLALVVGLGIVGVALPQGPMIVICALSGLGSLMVLAGFVAGAYGAFCEDVLYGFFYLVFPLYTAYYMVTRWEDLWIWLACSTAGVGLILIATEIARGIGLVSF